VVSALFAFAGVRRAQGPTLGYWLSRSALVVSGLIWLFVLSQVFS
jgi:hypothetical protein